MADCIWTASRRRSVPIERIKDGSCRWRRSEWDCDESIWTYLNVVHSGLYITSPSWFIAVPGCFAAQNETSANSKASRLGPIQELWNRTLAIASYINRHGKSNGMRSLWGNESLIGGRALVSNIESIADAIQHWLWPSASSQHWKPQCIFLGSIYATAVTEVSGTKKFGSCLSASELVAAYTVSLP